MSVLRSRLPYWVILIVFSFTLSACQSDHPFSDFKVISKSESKRPKWVAKERLESYRYVYFVGAVQSPEQGQSIAFQRAQRAYQRYISERAQLHLAEIEARLNQSNFMIYTRSFEKELFKKTKDFIRTQYQYYWEEVLIKGDEKPERAYHNYVVLRVDKKLFHNHVRQFFRRSIRESMFNEKQMTEFTLQFCLTQFESRVKAEKASFKQSKKEPVLFN